MAPTSRFVLPISLGSVVVGVVATLFAAVMAAISFTNRAVRDGMYFLAVVIAVVSIGYAAVNFVPVQPVGAFAEVNFVPIQPVGAFVLSCPVARRSSRHPQSSITRLKPRCSSTCSTSPRATRRTGISLCALTQVPTCSA